MTRTMIKKRVEVVDEPRLVKIHDKLYVPADFEKDHTYYNDPEGTKRYWGITTVLGVIAKPALYKWYADVSIDFVEKALADLKGKMMNEIDWPTLLDEARLAGFKRRDTAGEAGTTVHAEIEAYINYCMASNQGFALPLHATIKDEVERQTSEFVNWAVSNNVKFLGSEVKLCSEKLWVAGTCDFIAEIAGKLMVGDIKTSNSGIYAEHFLQGTAYAHMIKEMGLHTDFHGVVIVNIPKRGGITVKENYDLKGNFQAFKAALTLHKFKEGQKTKRIKK